MRDTDRENLVSYEDYEKLENRFNTKVFEVSVTIENVEELFFYLTKKIVENMKKKLKKNQEEKKKVKRR